MKTPKTLRTLFALSALSLLTACLSVAEAAEKALPFSPLTGAYSVGTTELAWIDQSRPEAWSSTPGMRRHVTAQVWYPTNKRTGTPDAPYLLSPEEFSREDKDAKLLRAFNDHALTRSFLNAKVAGGKFPVVLFNPGGGMSRMTSTFVCEELASHGYVVVAVEHYGYGKATNYPDGKPLNLDRAPVYSDPEFQARYEAGTASPEEIVQRSVEDWNQRERETIPVCIEDSNFVLGKIEIMARKGGLAGHLDLNRIGTMGWSQGGAESVSLLVHDPRVKAAVDLDGQMMAKDKDRLATSKPLMIIHANPTADPRPNVEEGDKRLRAITNVWERYLLDHSTGARYRVGITDSDHGDMSDYLLMLGHDDPALRAHAQAREQLVDRLTVSFFDRHLKGLDVKVPLDSPLLEEKEARGVSRAGEEAEESTPAASAL